MLQKVILISILLIFPSCSSGDDAQQNVKPVIVTKTGGINKGKIPKPVVKSAEKEVLTILFSDEMDKNSVEKNLRIYPEMQSVISWKGAKKMEIQLNSYPRETHTILININREAKTLGGKILGKTLIKEFKVSKNLKVDFVSPEGEVTDLTKKITVKFNQPVVALTILDKQIECPLQVTPKLEGKCVWISTSTFQFRPQGGLTLGAGYTVVIPEGTSFENGKILDNEKRFTITTPEFKLNHIDERFINSQKFNIVFNAPVDLDTFKEHIQLQELIDNGNERSEISLDSLQIEYGKEKDLLGNEKIKQNHILLSIKQKKWGYDKKYMFTLKAGLTSIGGNIGIKKSAVYKREVGSILNDYSQIILRDTTKETTRENIIFQKEPKLILQKEAIMSFNFAETIPSRKDLFEITSGGEKVDFEFFQLKTHIKTFGSRMKDMKDFIKGDFVNNKGPVVIKLKGDIKEKKDVTIKIKVSKFSNSTDIVLKLGTSQKNTIEKFEFKNYKTSCIYFSKKLPSDYLTTRSNLENFDFGENGSIIGLREVQEGNKECSKVRGTYGYIASTLLKANSSFTFKIGKQLLDENYYSLDIPYGFKVKTGDISNKDKYLVVDGNSSFEVIPKASANFGMLVKTKNINKISVKVCNSDIKVENQGENFMGEQICELKNIAINNKGFHWSYTVLNLRKIFGRDFGEQVIRVFISKLSEDIYKQKIGEYYYGSDSSQKVFIINGTNAVIRSNGKKHLIWLYDFHSGKNIGVSKIKEIKSFNKKYDTVLKKNIYSDVAPLKFVSKNQGLIEIANVRKFSGYIVELFSGEKILLQSPGDSDVSEKKVYIHLDRPLYNPGNTVHLKGFIREQTPSGFNTHTSTGQTITVSINGPGYSKLEEKKVEVSSNGGFEYNFTLKQTVKLGQYSVYTGGKNISQFRVEEYEKPDFKVNITTNKEEYIYSDKVALNISSQYYLGANLSHATGNYSIYEKKYNFDGGETEGYIWGIQDSYFWYDHWGVKNENFNYKSVKKFKLDGKGIFKDSFILEGEENKIYKLDTTVVDPKTNKSVSTSKEFKVLNSKIFAGISFDKYYYNFGDKLGINYVSVDKNGKKLGYQKLKVLIKKIYYKDNKNTGELEKKEKILWTKDISTNALGVGETSFRIEEHGEIIVEIQAKGNSFKTRKTFFIYGGSLLKSVKNSHKLNIFSKENTYNIGDTAEVNILSELSGRALITIEKQGKIFDYKIIDVSGNSVTHTFEVKKEYLPNFYVHATLIGKSERTNAHLSELQKIRSQMPLYEEKLKNLLEEDIILYNHFVCTTGPSTFISHEKIPKLLLLKLSSLKQQEERLIKKLIPQYQSGTVKIGVSKQSVTLDAQVIIDKKLYLPGGKQIIDLVVKDNDGRTVNGEATVVLVDEALLALKKKEGDNALDFFYNPVQNQVRSYNLLDNFVKRLEFFQKDLPDTGGTNLDFQAVNTKSDMMKGASLSEENFSVSSKSSPSENGFTKLRKDFKDIAHYVGSVKVVNGKAQVVVDSLPDNLTTWVINGFVITDNTKIGTFKKSFKVTNDLSIIPSLPRFFIIGDMLEVRAVVLNNSNKSLSVIPELEITNAEIIKKPSIQTLKAKSETVYVWELKIKKDNIEENISDLTSKIKIVMTGGSFEDSIMLERDILPYSTAEGVFTNGQTKKISFEEKFKLPLGVDMQMGSLDINLGTNVIGNLFTNITDIIPRNMWFNSYYIIETLDKLSSIKHLYNVLGESEKLSTIVIKDENNNKHSIEEVIIRSLEELTDYSHYNGGIAYTSSCRYSQCENFNLTLKALKVLNKLEKLGYQKEIKKIKNQTIDYLKRELKRKIADAYKKNTKYKNIDVFITLYEAGEKTFVQKNIKSLGFGKSIFDKLLKIKLYRIGKIGISDNKELISELKNRIIIEARGSFLPSGRHSNDISTAKFLTELILSGENEILLVENMARFLSSSTGNKQLFGKTEIIDALTLFIQDQDLLKETHFDAKGYLDKKEIIKQSFTKENKYNNYNFTLPLSKNIEVDKEYSLGFSKTGTGVLYYDVNLNYYLPIETITSRDEGIIISRKYYSMDDYNLAYKKQCYSYGKYYGNSCYYKQVKEISEVVKGVSGELLVGEIEVTVDSERNNVVVEGFIPAGATIVNSSFDTTSKQIKSISSGNNIYYGFSHIETKKDKVFMFAEKLYAGTYTYKYVLKLNHNGKYHNKPARAYVLDKKEIWGRTKGGFFEIIEK